MTVPVDRVKDLYERLRNRFRKETIIMIPRND
jgi:hypothetical protein